MVNSNDTSQFPHIQLCPSCGGIPEPKMNGTETAMRLECESCGFSSLYVNTADEAVLDWLKTCNEYMQAKRSAGKQFELLRSYIEKEIEL